MDKRTFLKSTALLGITAALPSRDILSGGAPASSQATCTLIPSETAGPFPLDLTTNTFYFRQDVREDRIGVPLKVRMRIVGADNCAPMPNVRVNIWHCDKEGQYSGYDNSMNPGQAGKTYLRGYQIADANGEVEFLTIFPGWYPGRVCHIHFQVYVSTSYSAVSQLTFPQDAKQTLYTANTNIYTEGADPLAPSQDGVFADGYAYQMATLTVNEEIGGYESFLELTVRGAGVTSVGYEERINATHFSLGQNYPNPAGQSTTIPFTLEHPSDVELQVFDLQGRIVHRMDVRGLSSGAHTLPIDLHQLGLMAAGYVYQLTVRNSNGVFSDVKMMTVR
jgi:protocatechuate 3,4-dioxygenase beta subunit